MHKEERNTFTNSFGFVLAAAASAVGLGNIWRFPYLAARDGGGVFLVTYIILAVTFGFTLLITEVAIGRKTKQSPLTAYKLLHPRFGFLGRFAFLVPYIIYPYYCVIGGWVIKYMVDFCIGNGAETVRDGYFGAFISSPWSPIVYTILFSLLCLYIVYKGVNKGIERYSRIIMTGLVLLIVLICGYSLTISHTDESGVTRTGLEGAAIYFVPNFDGMTLKNFLFVLLDAMGQLFYSLSIAMGIMVAYGSYMRKDVKLGKAVDHIEIFDTVIAILAGMMIVPAVYVFMGTEGMDAGPGLMFIALPKVFSSLGVLGNIIGALFFIMVAFAALTSAVSILEAITVSMIDRFKISRPKAVCHRSFVGLILSVVVCLGYNKLFFNITLPNGAQAQLLDVMDYVSNNILMPIIAIGTCILVGWVIKPKVIIDEICLNGYNFWRKQIYIVMIKYVAPIMLFILFLGAFGLY